MRDQTFRIFHRGYDPSARTTRVLRSRRGIGFLFPSGRRVRRGRPLDLPGKFVLDHLEIVCTAMDEGVLDVCLVADGLEPSSLSSHDLKKLSSEAPVEEKTVESETGTGEESTPEGTEGEPGSDSVDSDLPSEGEQETVPAETPEGDPEPMSESVPESETETEVQPAPEPTESGTTEKVLPPELDGATVSSLKRKYTRAELNDIAARAGLDPTTYRNETSLARALIKLVKE